jgi:TatD DNase family protein
VVTSGMVAAPPVLPCEASVARLVDTHAHLSDRRFAGDLAHVLERARRSGVTGIIVVGYDVGSSETAVELANRYPNVWAAVGVHPHHADSFQTATRRQLFDLARNQRVVAIGECGLDYYRNLSPAVAQRQAFEAQLKLAIDLELPVIVHSRQAMGETLSILANRGVPNGGVLHCFDGTANDARRAVELGLHVSCAGMLTYRKDPTLADAFASVPEERLVVETDCPYLSPAEHRGERNEPAFIRSIAEALARVRRQTLEQVAEITTANAVALFRTPALSGDVQDYAA